MSHSWKIQGCVYSIYIESLDPPVCKGLDLAKIRLVCKSSLALPHLYGFVSYFIGGTSQPMDVLHLCLIF